MKIVFINITKVRYCRMDSCADELETKSEYLQRIPAMRLFKQREKQKRDDGIARAQESGALTQAQIEVLPQRN